MLSLRKLKENLIVSSYRSMLFIKQLNYFKGTLCMTTDRTMSLMMQLMDAAVMLIAHFYMMLGPD